MEESYSLTEGALHTANVCEIAAVSSGNLGEMLCGLWLGGILHRRNFAEVPPSASPANILTIQVLFCITFYLPSYRTVLPDANLSITIH